MALFKPFRGSRASLDALEKHDGYAYFCTDDGSFHIDYMDSDGTLKRKQINAYEAKTLTGMSLDDILNEAKDYTDSKQHTWKDITNKPFITEGAVHTSVLPANAGEDEAYLAKCAYDSNGNHMPFLTHVIPPIGTEVITVAAGNSNLVVFLSETHDAYSIYSSNTDSD